MSTVPQWSGREVRALREARRMSVREFAAHLGVSDRMVSKWEAGGATMRPRSMNQAALDTSLATASPEARTRFERLAGAEAARIEASAPGLDVRHLVRHPVDGKLMTLIEAGAHTLPEGPAAWLPGFYIDVFPTTSQDYHGFVTATGHRLPAQWPAGQYLDSIAESLAHVPWVDALAYATWASKSLPSPAQLDRAADGDSGLVLGHLAEWCATPRGPGRHDPRRAGGTGHAAFRCVVGVVEMLALLAI
jgi:transcriptional regulator with XRE-family HTH domain